MVPGFAATAPTRAEYCDYGHLFSYVPGDSGNPFVALWQATLVNAAILAVGALVLLVVSRLAHWAGIRYLGFTYLVASVLSGLLALIILRSSTPPGCNGVPGAPPLTADQQRVFDTFLTLRTLAGLTLYLTVLLVAVLVVALVYSAVTRRTGARLR